MSTDLRKKGCPNEECERHQRKVMLPATEEYCPKCGTPLIYVCARCFKEIEDTDPSHRICSLCEAQIQERNARIMNTGAKVIEGISAVISPVVLGAFSSIGKGIEKGLVGPISKGVAGLIERYIKKM